MGMLQGVALFILKGTHMSPQFAQVGECGKISTSPVVEGHYLSGHAPKMTVLIDMGETEMGSLTL